MTLRLRTTGPGAWLPHVCPGAGCAICAWQRRQAVPKLSYAEIRRRVIARQLAGESDAGHRAEKP